MKSITPIFQQASTKGKLCGNASVIVPKQEEAVNNDLSGPLSYMMAKRRMKAKSVKQSKKSVEEAKSGKERLYHRGQVFD